LSMHLRWPGRWLHWVAWRRGHHTWRRHNSWWGDSSWRWHSVKRRHRWRWHSIIRILRPSAWSRGIITTTRRRRHHIRRRLIIIVPTIVRVHWGRLIVIHTISRRLMPLASTMAPTASTTSMMMLSTSTTIIPSALVS
jgi:hypothetical protein